MKVLDLFSGIGGFSLGLERAGFETVAFCEIDEFCQKVLSKNFPGKKIFNDIKKITKEEINGLGQIDVVCGGFPCQPYSIAGQKKGRQDDRDLWPEMFRVIQESKPNWVIGENVANFIGMEFTRSKIDLESEGYIVQPFTIPACAIGAQHRRDRVWIIAYLDSNGLSRKANASEKQNNKGKRESDGWAETSVDFGYWWANQSDMGRAIHGFSRELDKYRKHRIKALGNAVVPVIPEIIGRAIMESVGNRK